MKVKINGEEKELLPMKGRVARKIRNVMLDVQKTETDAEQAEKVKELMDLIDDEAAKLVGMTVEELDDLDVDEKNEVTSYIVKKIQSSLDFLKSSSPQAN